VFVDGSVHVPPQPGDAHVGLIHEPAITDTMPTRRAASINSGVKRCTHR
jgi:hypothetical protein